MDDIASYYDTVELDSDKFTLYFKILKGKFVDTLYKYDTVSLGEPTPDDSLPFSFKYTVTVDPYMVDQSPNSDFTVFLSRILIDFLSKNHQDLISGAERKDNIRKKKT